MELKGRTCTKPVGVYKQQIPIRAFGWWDKKSCGLTEADFVAHWVEIRWSDFAHTLDVSDKSTPWTEPPFSEDQDDEMGVCDSSGFLANPFCEATIIPSQ